MTKIDGRSKKEATRQLEESLRRLETDCVDLVQHHEIIRYEDPHRIFDEDGANAALLEAQKSRQITLYRLHRPQGPAHPPAYARSCREHGYKFDSVQMPLNVMDAHYRSFEKLVLPELPRKNRRARDEDHGERNDPEIQYRHPDGVPALRTEPPNFGCDYRHGKYGKTRPGIRPHRSFRPMSEANTQSLLAKTKKAASKGEFELFKTSSVFDATAQNPAFLGEEPTRLQQVVQA